MGGLGVIVEYLPPSLGKENGKDKVSCSGIFFGNGWILTHGTLVIDVLKEEIAGPLIKDLKTKDIAFNYKNSDVRAVLDTIKPNFQVIFDKTILKNSNVKLSDSVQALPQSSSTKSSVLSNYYHYHRLQGKDLRLPLVTSLPETPQYFRCPANVGLLFRQPGITDCLQAMMPTNDGWKLAEDKDEGGRLDSELESIILSLFVMLRVNFLEKDKEKSVDMTQLEDLSFTVENLLTHTSDAIKGASVYIESSPFGSLSPSVFLNSLSKGIISNVCGHYCDIYLTDARCMMGGEGAPVYTVVKKKVNLCAIVMSSFCWKNGEWLGLSILAAIKPVLQMVQYLLGNEIYVKESTSRHLKDPLELSSPHSLDLKTNRISLEGIAKYMDYVVVGISCGGGWGSGVVINTSPGIILTCAHVVQHSVLDEVTVITTSRNVLSARVIYCTSPRGFCQGSLEEGEKCGSSMWDIALIQTSNSLPAAIRLATCLPSKGSTVLVAGHGILSPYRSPAPSVSHGIISKIISVEAKCLRFPKKNWDNSTAICKNKEIISSANESVIECSLDSQKAAQSRNSSFSSNSLNGESFSEVSIENIDEKDMAKITSLYYGKDGLVPVMFQTSCSVYAGNSGGPVVLYHPVQGLQVIGVMVCNTKDLTNKATFPNINLAVPTPAISRIISSYLLSKDIRLLSYLGVECPSVSQLWALDVKPQSHL